MKDGVGRRGETEKKVRKRKRNVAGNINHQIYYDFQYLIS